MGFGADTLANLGLEKVIATDAGETVGREIHDRVARKDGESFTSRSVDGGTQVDGFAKILGKGGTGRFPNIVVTLSAGHIGTEIKRETVGRDGRIEIVVVGVAEVNLDGGSPFTGLKFLLFGSILFVLLTFLLVFGVLIVISILLAFLTLLGGSLAGLSLLGSLLFLINGSSLGRSIDGATMTLVLYDVAPGEINGGTVGRETSFTFVVGGINLATLVKRGGNVRPTLIAVFIHGVERREVLASPYILSFLPYAIARRGEDQRIGIVTHETGRPIVIIGVPIGQACDDMAATVSSPTGDLDKGFLAREGQFVARDQLKEFVIIAIGIVKFATETAHLGHIVINLRLDRIVACLYEAAVSMLSLRIVVHQTVAFSHLEIDAVFLRPITSNLVISFLIAFEGEGVLLVLKLLVSRGGNTILSRSG